MKKLFSILLVVWMLFSFSVCAFADTAEEKGFVEYSTDVSVNFNEVVEVILTEKETGFFYSHKLYRINDYTANFAIPFGTYSVSAKVISDKDDAANRYSLSCSSDEIVINNSMLAVPLSLKIDILDSVEVTPSDFYDDVEIETEGTINSEDVPSEDKKEEKDNSLWISTLCYGGIIIIACIVYFIYKRKNFNK